MIISANGIQYFTNIHQQQANRPTLILLHGFMGSGRSFKYNTPLLQSCCNPTTIDLLGHGKTEGAQLEERFQLKYQLADLNVLIQKLSGSKPILHGYSMGGRLALRYALTHPNTLNGLILESSNHGLEDHAKIRERRQVDEERAKAIESDFEAFLEEWEKVPLFHGPDSLPEERQGHYHSIQKAQGPQQMARSLRGFGTAEMPSVKDQLGQLEIPTLLLAGAADAKYTKIMRQMHKLISYSTYSIIPGASHRVHIDNPKAHASAIQTFINKR